MHKAKGYVVVAATPVQFPATVETIIVPKTLYKVTVSFGNKTIYLDPKDGKSAMRGYFYSVEKGDSVFILPKVFIKEIKYIDAVDDKEKKRFLAFGRYNPEKIIYIQDGIQNEDIINLSKRGDRAVVF